MKMKTIYKLVFILFCSMTANSQIVPDYRMYNQNLMLVNPADAGINEDIIANLGHKIQWLGFKDAPLNTYLSVDGLINRSMGCGLFVSKQKMGLLNITNINLIYSYRLEIDNQHSIAFGVNMNFLQNKISISGLSDYELADVALNSNKFDESLFTNGAGVSYRLNNFSVDVSSPLLFSYQENKLFQTVNAYLAYDIFLSEIWKIQPSTLIKYSSTNSVQTDINVLVDWNSNIWGQATYITNKDVVFAAGLFFQYIGIGYAYSMNVNSKSNISNNSHEIMLKLNSQFSLGKKKRINPDGKNKNKWK